VSWYATKKIAGLEYYSRFSCYSTLRRWVYAKCRPGLTVEKRTIVHLPKQTIF